MSDYSSEDDDYSREVSLVHTPHDPEMSSETSSPSSVTVVAPQQVINTSAPENPTPKDTKNEIQDASKDTETHETVKRVPEEELMHGNMDERSSLTPPGSDKMSLPNVRASFSAPEENMRPIIRDSLDFTAPDSAPNSALSSAASSAANSVSASPTLSFADDTSRPQSPGMGQSIMLSQVPRYARLTVDQPQKITDGSSSYVSYLVTSQAYPEEKPDRVRRRFSEFAKLYDNLAAQYAWCAMPPLPDRHKLEYIAGDRFSSEFTKKRAASLERFLFRVSQHPLLRKSRHFAVFLTGGGMNVRNGTTAAANSSSSLAAGTSSTAAASISAGGYKHTVGRIKSSLVGTKTASEPANVSVGRVLDQFSDVLMNAFAKARHQSKEMIDARERADRYEQNIATIDRAVVRTAKTQHELALDFEDMHRLATKLAKLEPESKQEFETLAATAQGLLFATSELRVGVDSQFACALRDMSHYVQALKGMLKQREQRQIDYEALVEYQKRTEHELVAAEHGQPGPTFSSSFLRTKMNELRGVDKEQARQQRIAKLKTKITEFKDESARAKLISDDFEELAKREVCVFDRTEAIELQQSLSGLSDSYIEYYQTVLRECRALQDSLDD